MQSGNKKLTRFSFFSLIYTHLSVLGLLQVEYMECNAHAYTTKYTGRIDFEASSENGIHFGS